jgi:hypothetical protein
MTPRTAADTDWAAAGSPMRLSSQSPSALLNRTNTGHVGVCGRVIAFMRERNSAKAVADLRPYCRFQERSC